MQFPDQIAQRPFRLESPVTLRLHSRTTDCKHSSLRNGVHNETDHTLRPRSQRFTRILGSGGSGSRRSRWTPSTPSAGTSPHSGYTYVNDNTAGANTIAGFQRHADGSLTPLSGSPFNAGGVGLGGGLASQGAIQATTDGRYLLAVDAGSNQISVLRVNQNGVPVLVGPPVSSGGIKPVSVAISPTGLVYVANSGTGGSGYSGFQLHNDGTLTAIPHSTVTVPDNSGVGDVFFNAFGDKLVGARTGTSLIDSFVVLPNGRLLAAPGSPFTGQGLGQLGAEFSPTNPWRLFVSNAHNGAGLGTVSAYNDSWFGQLNVDRGVALPRRPNRTVLGRDQPQRQVPVHRQHGIGNHLQLRHQPRRLTRPHREHRHQGRRLRHRCAPHPRW